ncbi:TetR/AcrR family transcriptional regulator [Pseudonocardia petroleophila]|uniref:TetR/AcrR family transcriptional regulator n=1 Tax=Pseudonocardia petroleophila TaxID=37331 RepID=A0A7G7MBK7_9PSEU|nr:TetR/AcrR family transcriptional regulator [Pseudonocardia petroleophila]QNG50168.1 TetR/AcrR family transcriptional regulator [Pseudonocardia petroleophila]
MPKAGGRIRDPERRERILGAAADLIAQHGFLGVNLTDIGAAAGIVGSGIYRHFPSKSAILVEMFDRVVDRLVVDAEGALRSSGDPRATLASLVDGQVRFTLTERRLCQVYLQESRNVPEQDLRRLRWKQRHYIDLWQDVLTDVRPELSAAEAKIRVHAAISVIHSCLRYRIEIAESELAVFLSTAAERALGVDVAGPRIQHSTDESPSATG